MAVAAVAVKLPEFWEEDPSTWFIEAESQFALAGVTADSTKYHHIVKSITSKATINAVWDIISNPPDQNKYYQLKTRLLHVFADSHQSRIEKLMTVQMGDMKPTQYLCYLRRLSADTGINDQALKAIFLRGLPSRMSSVLILSGNNLSDIAYYGDQMLKQEPEINQINHSDGKYDQLKQEVEHLTAAIRDMKFNRSFKPNFRQSRQNKKQDICWYHTEYGKNARKCLQPCKFQKN